MTLYDRLGGGYAKMRRPDPRISARIRAAIGSRGLVLNVGAGTGSYEPADLAVVAVEPATVMLQQRSRDAAPAVQAVAEALPFADRSFAAGMAVSTVHHWDDLAGGLSELRRVIRGVIAVLSWDMTVFNDYWVVAEYVPASRRLDRDLPSPETIAELLGGGRVETVPVPADCTDGFYAAWWRRPAAYLEPAVRDAISGLARLAPEEVQPGIKRLSDDLASGEWQRRHAALLELDSYDGGCRLIVASDGR